MMSALTAFRATSLAGMIAAIAQVTLGGVVRVTNSGDACPDWPLCHGQIVPPLDYHTMLEYAHRLSATVVAVLVFAALIAALIIEWRRHRANRPALLFAGAAAVLVCAAVVLGGVTVLTELAWWARLVHLSLAELVVACMAAAWLAAGARPIETDPDLPSARAMRFGKPLVWGTLAGIMGLTLYGSYMVGVGYGASCSGWPLCQGWDSPDGVPYAINMGHRYLTVIVGLLALGACAAAWRAGGAYAELRGLAALLMGFFLLESLVGALTVWLDFTAALKSLHLAVATLAWASAALLAAVYLAPQSFRLPALQTKSPQS